MAERRQKLIRTGLTGMAVSAALLVLCIILAVALHKTVPVFVLFIILSVFSLLSVIIFLTVLLIGVSIGVGGFTAKVFDTVKTCAYCGKEIPEDGDGGKCPYCGG